MEKMVWYGEPPPAKPDKDGKTGPPPDAMKRALELRRQIQAYREAASRQAEQAADVDSPTSE